MCLRAFTRYVSDVHQDIVNRKGHRRRCLSSFGRHRCRSRRHIIFGRSRRPQTPRRIASVPLPETSHYRSNTLQRPLHLALLFHLPLVLTLLRNCLEILVKYERFRCSSSFVRYRRSPRLSEKSISERPRGNTSSADRAPRLATAAGRTDADPPLGMEMTKFTRHLVSTTMNIDATFGIGSIRAKEYKLHRKGHTSKLISARHLSNHIRGVSSICHKFLLGVQNQGSVSRGEKRKLRDYR